MYCPKCKKVFDGGICPACGNKKVREPAADDICFLVEKEQVWSDMLAEVLEQNEIPFLKKGRLGAGMAMNVGPLFERCRFYVSYDMLERARDIVDGLFSGPADGEDID